MRQHRIWSKKVRSTDGRAIAEVMSEIMVDGEEPIRVERSHQATVSSDGQHCTARSYSVVQVTSINV